MKNILIVYGTTEGQTRKIAQFIADEIKGLGHHPTVVDTTDVPKDLNVGTFDAVIAAGSLHQGRHQWSLTYFIKDRLDQLKKIPGLMVSVSLTAVIDDDLHRSEARECMDVFIKDTEWQPSETLYVAGALKYTQYDWLKRFVMRKISEKEHRDTDTSQDYEYTDWEKLKQDVKGFLERNLLHELADA